MTHLDHVAALVFELHAAQFLALELLHVQLVAGALGRQLLRLLGRLVALLLQRRPANQQHDAGSSCDVTRGDAAARRAAAASGNPGHNYT